MATLINITEVASKIPADHNPDPNLYAKHIQYAEDRHVSTFLGETMYNALVTAAAGDASNTLTGDNLTLWNRWLHEMCAYAVLYEAYPYSAFRITNQGLMRNSTRNSESASATDVRYARDAVFDRLKRLQSQADEWLRDRSTTYTTYKGNVDDDCDATTGSLAPSLGIVGVKIKRPATDD